MRIILHSIKAAGLFALSFLLFSTFLIPAENAHAQEEVVTFNFTGAQQSFIVPPGVFSIHIQVWGAQGSDTNSFDGTGSGGLGGFSEGELAVTPGQTLEIFVGGHGTAVSDGVSGGGGFNGGGNAIGAVFGERGGGGGASDVRVGGTDLSDRVIVAAGGGGSCGLVFTPGGDGGGLTGGSSPVEPGEGGTQDSGGVGFMDCLDGEFGIGGDSPINFTCGGGGGGWFGGGAGCGGGGGSSYIDGVENGETNSGVREGDGLIVLTFRSAPRPIPTLSEWGLIAMAGVLGLVGIIAVTRRKQTF